jgi:gliding motility-associated-like protein
MTKTLTVFILLFLFSSCKIFAQQVKTTHDHVGSSMIRFTENLRQWDQTYLYRAQLDGGALWLQKDAFIYSFYDKETYRECHAHPRAKRINTIKTTGFKVSFKNSNPGTSIESYEPTHDYSNYFIGKDPSRWAGNVKNYKRLLYKNLWQGIHLELLGQQNSMKYNFYVEKGADPSAIQLVYEKTEKITLHKNILTVKTQLNEMVEFEPYAYQEINGKKVEVPCDFTLSKNVVSYSFPYGYDRNYELVVDPVLVFACSSGSTADNFGMTATYDSLGNLYSGGTCFDQGFPVVNPYDGTYNGVVQYGMTDVVLTKYDSSGAFLQYSTYIGGAISSEIVTSLIVDSQNNLYLYGATGSNDFPMTASAWDNTFNGGDTVLFMFNGTYFYYGTDIYVAKISAGGNALLGSTYIGGSENDGINTNNVIASYLATLYGITVTGEYPPDSLQFNYGDQYRGEIQLDINENPIICSSSRSPNFPTQNAADNTLGGYQDAVVFKFDQTLSSLQWSTFVGGSNNDAGYALFVAQNNEVYFTGGTRSTDFPATTGAYKTTYQGGKCDGFIGRLSANGSTLLSATYIGTSLYDQSYFIQLDNQQNAYVFGQSAGSMPVLNVGYSSTNGKLFVSKLDSTLSTLVYSTVIGNGTTAINLSPAAFLIDCAENIYLSGWGGNIIFGPATNNMPLTSGAIQSSTDGYNFYLMVMAKNAQSLLHGTYFGGSQSREHVDGGTSRFDKKGIIYQSVCAGCGGNDDFPVTPGAWPTSVYGNNWNQSFNCNNGTFKILFEYVEPQSVFAPNYVSGCEPLTVTFSNTSISYNNFIWDFGNGDTTSLIVNPVQTYTVPGTYTVTLLTQNSACSNNMDSATTIISVYPLPQAAFTTNYDSCANSASYQNSSTVSSGTISYNWNLGNTQTSTATSPGPITYNPGNYTVTLIVTTDKNCKDTLQQPVGFTLAPYSSYPDSTICNGQTVQLNASGGNSYLWQPSTGLTNPAIANPVASPSTTTIYTVNISQTDFSGNNCTFPLTNTITVNPTVTANFTYAQSGCTNTISFTDSSYANITDWNWNFGDGFTDNSQNPTHSYSTTGNYTVTLIADNLYGCSDTVQDVLSVGSFSPISVSAQSTICSGNSVQLNATGGVSYQWSPAAGLNNPNIPNPVASPTATTQYSVSISQVSGTDTCVSVLTTSVTIAAYPTTNLVAFANPDTINLGESTQLGTLTSGGSIVWSPAYNISNVTDPNPTANPLHTTTYTAMYTDANGCSFPVSSVTVWVLASSCEEKTVFVPNTFTPNSDGKNDILFARSGLLQEIYFAVYDRWGQLVFETTDLTKGWDGNFNGKACNPDVFGYYIKYKCNNGEESFKKGNVTLIR